MSKWMLYGAYGYTGRLLVDEALARGHEPILAGRDEKRLRELGEEKNLPWRAFGLDKSGEVRDMVADVEVVLHAAGPFTHTAEPMIQGCLAGQTHYMDITGEIPVFEMTLSYDSHAREQGVVLVSGMGFDIVPSNCLAAYVAEQLPEATHLEIALSSFSRVSAGTVKSMLEMLAAYPAGVVVRRNGKLVDERLGREQKEVLFANGKRLNVVAIPWGDVAVAEQTTGIPNITAYMAMPSVPGLSVAGPLMTKVATLGPVRSALGGLADLVMHGPDESMRGSARAYFWARAYNQQGEERQAWLESCEPYRFTAEAGVRAVEALLQKEIAGALTPAEAFGIDFVLEIPGTVRYDTL